ncbi:efflux RND transporter periplasmic adaptor subunit [Thermodesulforhabdus norvegica]|uniref:HlyD family secretion protein n=1 Tax=Thermodesulforhabdus norvegica TaxID=39841 RepID=A0A1I4S4W6_9BACT|nr:efflux RND transporter periplasmic adaptor subunit [Thermodesulforhabdus norvegica]SFM59330.1 HlyD family secretion protein [Thermodesulforhabdus norvegica]
MNEMAHDSTHGKAGKKRAGMALVLAALALLFFMIFRNSIFGISGSEDVTRFRTEPVEKGDLTVTVTATGTLEPMDQVEVGVEVSGTIRTVEVDYNDPVKKDQVLARLDTSKFEAQVLQSQAKLDLARAKLKEAQADIKLARSKLEQYRRARKLTGGKSPSQIEMDEVEAQLAKAVAAEMSAKAEIASAQAELEYNKINLSKAIIRSPMDGIVLSRQVEPGQTVAASLQTPTLFIIARDLKEMELHVDVDEADIGKVRPGQKATFTVDAYPDKVFDAEVKEIWLSPETSDGVVTYETVLYVRNLEGLLLPGMTATADIIVSEKRNVTLIPNAALRFHMPDKNTDREDKNSRSGLLGMMLPRFPRRGGNSTESVARHAASGSQVYVWVLNEGRPEKRLIVAGESDGIKTEVLSGDIKPGDAVIVGIMPSGKS